MAEDSNVLTEEIYLGPNKPVEGKRTKSKFVLKCDDIDNLWQSKYVNADYNYDFICKFLVFFTFH